MNNQLIYTLRIWLTALLVSPFLIMIIKGNSPFNISGYFTLAMASLTFGALFSMPSVMLLWLTILLTDRFTVWKSIRKKIFWSFSSLVLSFVPFILLDLFIGIGLGGDTLRVAISYAIMIVAGIWLYRLKTCPRTNSNYVLDEGRPVDQ